MRESGPRWQVESRTSKQTRGKQKEWGGGDAGEGGEGRGKGRETDTGREKEGKGERHERERCYWVGSLLVRFCCWSRLSADGLCVGLVGSFCLLACLSVCLSAIKRSDSESGNYSTSLALAN